MGTLTKERGHHLRGYIARRGSCDRDQNEHLFVANLLERNLTQEIQKIDIQHEPTTGSLVQTPHSISAGSAGGITAFSRN